MQTCIHILSELTMIDLKAIVLAGGASSRLGFPKHLLIKEDLPILDWWQKSFRSYGIETYISCRQDQLKTFSEYPCIPDEFTSRGPMESLIQARKKFKYSSFLLTACDLLYIEKIHIEELLECNDPEFDCISYYQTKSNTLFPLFSIIHPSADPFFNEEYLHSNRSIKKAISNSKVKSIAVQNDYFLDGINTAEDLIKWKGYR